MTTPSLRPPSRRPSEPLLLAALAASLLAVGACGRGGDPGTIRLNGRLETPTVDLAPRTEGRVLTVRVREGDRVKAGDVLVTLDLGETGLAVPRDEAGLSSAKARLSDLEAGSRSAEIAAAEANVADKRAALSIAERELVRQTTLLDQRIGTEQDFDLASAARDRAKANLASADEELRLAREGFRRWQTEQARADVARARTVLEQSKTIAREAELRAPADGVVLHRLVEPGALIRTGQPALTLGFAERLYVRTFVPETQLGRVRPGQTAAVYVDAYPDRAFAAHVTEVSPDAEFTPKQVETSSERVNLVYAAKVDLDSGWSAPLVPGQPAEVRIEASAAGGPEPGKETHR